MQNPSSERYLRVDPQHELQQMLRRTAVRLFGNAVDVSLNDDHVLLTGRVANWHEKQLAQETVRPQAMPRPIRNEIVVA
ncbi:MAG: BON domain-containing protein [Planctomycetaceae bacterium]